MRNLRDRSRKCKRNLTDKRKLKRIGNRPKLISTRASLKSRSSERSSKRINRISIMAMWSNKISSMCIKRMIMRAALVRMMFYSSFRHRKAAPSTFLWSNTRSICRTKSPICLLPKKATSIETINFSLTLQSTTIQCKETSGRPLTSK